VSDIFIDEEQKKEVVTYLQEETNKAFYERELVERKWMKWRRQADARPEKDVKSSPWEGAANVCVPLTAMITDGIYAAMKSAFAARKPLITAKPLDKSPEDIRRAEVISKYLNILFSSPRHINYDKISNTLYRDLVLLGTQFVEIPWTIQQQMFKKRDDSGALIQVTQLQKNCPTVVPIRLEDFVARSYFTDPQTMPWYGIRHRFAEHEYRREVSLGFFEDVLESREVLDDEGLEHELRRSGVSLQNTQLYQIIKYHLFWDIDGDGFFEDIIVWMDPNTGHVARSEFNELGVRPVVRLPYVDVSNNLYAQGTGHMCEHLQDEVDALHNMRIDGTQLSMLQIIIARRGCGFEEDEEFYPLAVKLVSDPTKDVQIVKFPDIGPTSFTAESIARMYAERRTGYGPATAGFPDEYAKTRATFSGQALQAQQSDKLAAAVRDNTGDAWGEIAQMVVFRLIEHRDEVDLSLLSEEDVPIMQDILNIPIEDIPLRFRFSIQITDTAETEEARRQGLLMLANLYTQYWQGIFQLMPMFFNEMSPPQVQQAAAGFYSTAGIKGLTGASELMRKIFDYFGEDDVKKYIPYTKDLEMLTQAIENMKEMQVRNVRTRQAQGIAGNP